VTNVTDPALIVYRPASPNGAAILVFPGGGYLWLAIDIAGSEVCDRFVRDGITCFVVKYRVPQPDNGARYEQPLQDAQRAMSLVRLHAKEWNIHPDRIGAIGFSVGAQIVAVLSSHSQRAYPAQDRTDQQSFRPDFAVVLYPGSLKSSKQDSSVTTEFQPSASTPPTFVFQTEDDPSHVSHSLAYYNALKDAGVPAELHIYAKGGHGFGVRANNPAAEAWPTLVLKWLASVQMLSASVRGK
jgi:acetyl esterase/lipase